MSATRRSGRSDRSGKSVRSGKRVAELDDAKKSEMDQAQRDLIFADPKKIDFSGQAAVILPSSIFQRTEIEELHLENNNFRAIPPDISKLKRLRRLIISKNNLSAMLPEERSGTIPGPLPTQLELLTELVELNIAECNLGVIPDVVFKIVSLRVLNISRNKINVLCADVSNLVNLEVLNAQYCGLKTLPSDIICCENLTELILYGNVFESLPEELYALTKLTTLKLNTQYFTRKLDSHMEALVVRNQLQSTHVPSVLFELPAIRELSLECSKLNSLPNDITQSLETVSLKMNYFRQFPRSLLTLENLRRIDFSANRLSEIPDEIEKLVALEFLSLSVNDLGQLPESIVKLQRLEFLDASGNHIRNLPNKIGEMKALRTLILHHNAVRALPSSICQLNQLETLDVSYNNLGEIPGKMYEMAALNVAHSYRHLSRYGLWLKGNPLMKPPPDVWKTKDTENIWKWLRQQEYVKLDKVKQFKVILLGNSASGKSCLKDALLYHRPIIHRLIGPEASLVDSVFEQRDEQLRQTKSAPPRAAQLDSTGGKANVPDNSAVWSMVEQGAASLRERKRSIKFASEPNLAVDDAEQSSERWSLRIAESTESLASKRYAELLIAAAGYEATRLLSLGTHSSVDGIRLCVYDTGGHDTYRFLLPLFLHENAFVLVTVNLERFVLQFEKNSEAAYCDHVGKWIELCWTYTPQSVLKVVGTHLDAVKTVAILNHVIDWLTRRVGEHVESLKAAFRNELQLLGPSRSEGTGLSKAASSLLDNLDRFNSEQLPRMLVTAEPLLHLVSNTFTLENIEELKVSLASTANYSEHFKKLQIYISETWYVLRRKLKRLGKIVISYTEAKVIADVFAVKMQAFTEFLEYFSLIGDFIWLKNHATLSQMVVVRPTKFISLLQGVYRHDLTDFLDANMQMLKYKADVEDLDEFEQCRTNCSVYGQISEPMLRALWFYSRPTQREFHDWTNLIVDFEACYSIDFPDTTAARRTMRKALKVPIIAVPVYVTDVADLSVDEVLKLKPGKQATRVVCRATPFLPHDFAQRMSITLQDFVYERLDWQNMLFLSVNGRDLVALTEEDESDQSSYSSAVFSFYFSTSSDEDIRWVRVWLTPLLERVRQWYSSHIFSLWLDSGLLMLV